MALPTFYIGKTESDDVPGAYPCAVDGHNFQIDNEEGSGFQFVTIPLLKAQQDTSENVGEQSINPAGLWRRSVESWHKGAGQTNYDLADSDEARFRSSKGVDVWTPQRLTLLRDVATWKTSANTNLAVVPVGHRVYVVDGTSIQYNEADVTSVSNITGESATAANGAASDGFHLWTIHGTDGLYQTDNSSTSTAKGVTGNLRGMLAYVKGRIIASDNAAIYNITTIDTGTPAALPTALMTHANSDFEWVGAAEGPNHIYLAGYSGDKSLIYKTAIKADATGLDAPTIAGELPDGEIVRAVCGYLGFLVIGTDTGIRLATIDSNGNLTIGARIAMSAAVKCFEPQDRFVWFGWTNYDSTSTGLGRLDLSVLNGTAPAYASDLLVTAQGAVLSACTYLNRRWFAVSGSGIYYENTSAYLTQGVLFGGWKRFGLADEKNAVFFDLRTDPVDSTSVSVAIATDGSSTYTSLGGSGGGSDGTRITVNGFTAERFEDRYALHTTSTSTTPAMTRAVLHAEVTADTGFMIDAPLMFNHADEVNGAPIHRSPQTELEFIEEKRRSRDIVTLQLSNRAFAATVDDYRFEPTTMADSGETAGEWAGRCTTRFKVYGLIEDHIEIVVGDVAGAISGSIDGTSFTEFDAPSNNGVNGLAFGSVSWVAACADRAVLLSGSASSWAIENVPSAVAASSGHDLLGLAFSASQGRWVVTRASGDRIHHSTDLLTWTEVSLGSGSVLYSVARSEADGLWVVVGSGGNIWSSPSATTWTSRTSGTTEWLRCVTYSSGLDLFVAGGQGGAITYSSNGTSWTATTSGSEWFRGAAASSSMIVLVGNNGTIKSTTNGADWTTRTSGTTENLYAIAYSSSLGLWIAGGDNGTVLMSPDAATWTPQTVPTSTRITAIGVRS